MKVWALLFAVGLTVIAGPAFAARVNYAIIIGNNLRPSGHPELRDLRFADDDAARYYELFRRAGPAAALLTSFDAETQRRFPELASITDPPTPAALERTLAGFRVQMEQDLARGDRPVLFITYSGHGAEDASGAYSLALLNGGITRAYLFDHVLSEIPPGATVHLIIDACRAATVLAARGGFDKEKEGQLAGLNQSEIQLLPQGNLSQFPNVGALVASSSNEEAYEWNRIQSGVFTHVLLSGLLGAADVNGDRRIGYSEIAAFVSAATRSVPDSRVPHLQASPPLGGAQNVLVELDSLRDTVLLQGDPRGLGRVSVQLENGLTWLEARLNTSHVTLALPARGHALLRSNSGDAVLNTKLGSSLLLSALAFQPAAVAARGQLENPREMGLFEFPYDLGYYLGYVDNQGYDRVGFFSGPTQIDKSRITEGGTLGPAVLGVTSAVLLTVAGITGYVAWDAARQHDQTSIERDASGLDDRYRTYGSVSLLTGVVGALAGTGAVVWVLTPAAFPAQHSTMRWGLKATTNW